MVEIGKKIKELREAEKMTQKDLAELLHVTPQAISKWELNKSYPDLDTLVTLSQLYKISTDEILGNSRQSFFTSFFSSKKEKKSMWHKFWQMVYPTIYRIGIPSGIEFEKYPELTKMGTWRRKDSTILELVIIQTSPEKEMQKISELFQVITNLTEKDFVIQRIYQVFG